MAVIDVLTYNGERDTLKLHLSVTDPFVSKFIICEAKSTFTMQPKPLYFFRDQKFFKKFWHKINYYVIPDQFTEEEWAQAKESPNTQGAEHWKWEFLQKESLKKALKQAKVQDDDLCFIGDVDEIWDADPSGDEIETPAKLKLKVYANYLNTRSSEEFWGTYVARYKDFKDKCLNHERSRTDIRTRGYHGWHFTNCMSVDEIRRKLDNSYTSESYNTDEVQQNLAQRIENKQDYLGRNFTFHEDQQEWPDYLKKNKSIYKHLLYGNIATERIG